MIAFFLFPATFPSATLSSPPFLCDLCLCSFRPDFVSVASPPVTFYEAQNCGKATMPVRAAALLQHTVTARTSTGSAPEESAVAAIASAAHTDPASLQQLVEDARRAIAEAHASLQ